MADPGPRYFAEPDLSRRGCAKNSHAFGPRDHREGFLRYVRLESRRNVAHGSRRTQIRTGPLADSATTR
jgi:hypothetical protein